MRKLQTTFCALALAWLAQPGVASDEPPAAGGSHVVRLTPDLRADALRGRPDSDVVELPDGRRLRLGDLRRLTAFAGRLRSTPLKPLPAALTQRPAARGERVGDANALAAALSRPDSDTLELPSGRRLTVAQLEFLKPQIEKQLGRPLAAGAATRSAVKVDRGTDWRRILRMPDDTLLEAPDGTRVTVADLKRALRDDTGPRPAVRAGSRP
jgi:hypothetical protein